MDQSEFHKSQLPNTSLDDSPFLNLKTSRLRKKKTQSKLTYLKQVSNKRKKSDTPKVDEDDTQCETKSTENSLPGELPSSVDANYETASESKVENVIRACPVCWKRFENTGDQMQHMKTCATKHNLTLKQLLEAVDLQTKQIQERKTLGLPCVPATGIARKSSSKKSSSVNDKNDPDLQLGLALSVSMQESEEQNNLVEQEIMLEAGLGDEVAANQASLLERFGFTSTRPVLPSIYPRARPGKTKFKGTPLLLVRSQEERERLITEKVAIILTSEENKLSPPPSDEYEPSVKSSLQSEMLVELQNEGCYLWQKASASPSTNDFDLYYVESLSYIVSPSTIKAGSKLKHLSQVPCRLKTPEKCLPTTDEDPSLNLMRKPSEITTVFSKDSLSLQIHQEESPFSVCNRSENQEKINTTDTSNSKIQEKSSHFVSRFIGDWNNMLNNSSMSDIKIHVKNSEEIYVHELVLFVRCPNILLDVKQTNESMKCIIWDKISFKCAFAFLDFIYCGSTSKINDLKYNADEIMFLSTKYCVEDLCSYLKCIVNEGKDHVVAKCQDLNGIISHGNSEVVKTYNSDVNEVLSPNFQLVSACKSDIERSIVSENEMAKIEEGYIERNCESNNKAVSVVSPKRNDSLHDSCLSPDPFVDSCDNEIINIPCTRRSSSPNTQQNMDNLLEALNDDEGGKLHQIAARCSSKIDCELSGTCGIVKESPEVEIIEEKRDDIYNASTIKKRKLSNYCSSVDVKQICTNDRNSVRKSLLSSFSSEGEHSLPGEKDEAKISWCPKICNDNSLNSAKSVEKVSVKNSSCEEGAEEMNANSKEVLKEVDNTNGQSPVNDVVTIECSPSTSSEKSNDAQDKAADTSTDLLGDFCADYEYQNYCANYSPCNEEVLLHPNYDEEKSVENPVLVKQQFFETEEINKSPFSSPLSVKSLSRGDSPFSLKNINSRKKFAWTRTRSSSDISVNNDASSRSPISVKCLSQSSIHLKSSHDFNADKNKVQSVSDTENGGHKIGISSGMNVHSPITPPTHVQTPNRSLNSVKRLLEDSFTAELEKNLLERKLDCESWPCSTPNSAQSKKFVFSKHLQNIKDGNNCVTPMADYSGMDTPMLKKELQKYGLKPLKRKRAKQILRHIYNELHPLVPVQSSEDRTDSMSSATDGVLPLSCTEKQAKKIPTPKKSKKKTKNAKGGDAAAINSCEEADISSESEVSLPSTQESSSSSQCQFEILEEPAEDGALTQMDVSELPGVVLNYIRKNPEFHQQVLLYEPIWLEQLQEGLKAQNYKFKLTQLMEYLDEECITFRTVQGYKTKERQRKKKSK